MTNPSKYAQEFLQNGKLSLPTIDAHTHMGAVYGTSLSMSSAADMVAIMDRQNIECCISSPHSALFDPGAMNAELEAAMAAYPGRFFGYYAFNPHYQERYVQRLDDILKVPGYVGLKFLPGYHRMPVDGPGYRPALEFAQANSLLLLIHTWGHDPYNAPRQVEYILRQYPSITVLLGHSSPGEAETAIALARDYENAFLDLCDIHRHNGIVDRFVEGAGAHKVLFGTDMPWYDPTYCMGSILFSHISDADKEKIIYHNAKRLLSRFT